MPSYDITVAVKQDGEAIAGFPVVRRIVTDKAAAFTTQIASALTTTTWAALPVTDLSTIGVLVLHSDQPILIRYADETDGVDRPVLTLNQGGLLVWVDTGVGEGGGNGNLRVNNTSGAAATVQGVVGGT